jgi:hypothetical protein
MEVKEARSIMRRVESHLRQSHLDMGAKEENVGFVDVIHHASSPLPSLNYVTPRKNTAWVSGNHIQHGLDALQEKGRALRVRFAEGLYPPVFENALRELGLKVESEIPIMVFKNLQTLRKTPSIPDEVTFARVDDAEGMSVWWYIWRNAFYDVMVSSVEPLLIGSNLRDVYLGRQINLVMYRQSYPMGALRITIHEGSAHLVAQAMIKEMRKPQWERLIHEVSLDVALNEGVDMVFTSDQNVEERKLYRELGFVDSGSIVTFSEPSDTETDGKSDDPLAQSVLVV